jgi:hypothetical protein
MSPLFVQTLDACGSAFRAIEQKVSPPRPVQMLDGFVFRTSEQTLEQAVVQKLSRVVSTLHATLALLNAGAYQEVGILFRVLDELNEDVLFLCQSMRDGNVTPLHQEYLDAFYQEEFDDPSNPMTSSQKRPMVSRRKIHAALAAISDSPMNPSDSQELHRTIGKTLSGYVHAASGHVLESYGGDPPHFHLFGMLGTPRQAEFENQAVQYFYRGMTTLMYVVVCFKDQNSIQRLYEFRSHFEREAGMTGWQNPDEAIRNLRKGTV